MEPHCNDCRESSEFRCHGLVFCKSCIKTHVTSSFNLTHVITDLSDPQPIDCEFCGDKPILKCHCSLPPTLFCSACFSSHNEHKKESSHRIEYIFDTLNFSGQFPLLQDRVKRIQYLREKIHENLYGISEFEKNLEFEKETLKNMIENRYRELDQNIEKAESYLGQVTADLEACKRDPDASETTVMQKHNFQISKAKQLRLFEADLDVEPSLAALKTFATINLKLENFKSDPRIFYFKPRTREFSVIDLKNWSQSKKPFPKSVGLKDNGSWCELPNSSIFYCGGVQAQTFSAEAYIIEPLNFSIVRLPDMIQPRALCALTCFKRSVYVFGGYSGTNLNICEKFELKREAWSQIASMPIARSAFSVVQYKGCFYMTGDSKDIDKYNPKTDSFETFTDVLPESSAYSTLACVDNSLFVFQNAMCCEVNLEKMTIICQINIPQGKWWSFFPAKVIDNDIACEPACCFPWVLSK